MSAASICLQATPGSSGKKGSANKAAAASKEDKSAEPKPAGSKEPSAAAELTTASSKALASSPAAAKSSSAAQDSVSLRKAVGRSDSNVGSPMVMPATPVAIQGSNVSLAGRRSGGFDVAGTSSDSLWGSSNSGSGWNAYERGKKAAGKQQGLMGSSPSNEGGNSKAGRRARRNAKKAAADAKADVYAY